MQVVWCLGKPRQPHPPGQRGQLVHKGLQYLAQIERRQVKALQHSREGQAALHRQAHVWWWLWMQRRGQGHGRAGQESPGELLLWQPTSSSK